MSKLFARTANVAELSQEFKKSMFKLFQTYYENTHEEKFHKDLNAKEKSILLEDKEGSLRGFSTITEIQIQKKEKTIYGVFSGDTVIDSNFWGGTALTMEFFKNVLRVKIKHPKSEVYWFLISKGFKTYLLLANNFKNYYPRYDKETPDKHKEIIEHFAIDLYGDQYQKGKLIIKACEKFDRLKDSVAPISKVMSEENPKIAFFEKMNPHWQEGDELCCIGKIDIGLVTQYLSRTLKKILKYKLKL